MNSKKFTNRNSIRNFDRKLKILHVSTKSNNFVNKVDAIRCLLPYCLMLYLLHHGVYYFLMVFHFNKARKEFSEVFSFHFT